QPEDLAGGDAQVQVVGGDGLGRAGGPGRKVVDFGQVLENDRRGGLHAHCPFLGTPRLRRATFENAQQRPHPAEIRWMSRGNSLTRRAPSRAIWTISSRRTPNSPGR